MLGEKMMERGESEDYAPYRIPLYAMINLIDTLILGMELPAAIVHAINRKIEQYYISEEYTFRIEREKKESERKRIEGEGIRSFQQIVSQGISDSYLRWRGIEATLQLAQSNNSKIVIIGSGKEGLPIILGNVDAPPAPPAATPPAGNGGAATKDKPTAASPAAASEQVPAAAPASGTPASPPEKASAPEKKSSTTPDATQPAFPFPLSLSDIEAFFSRLSGTAPRATTPEAGAGR
jgi:hypothetical protein